MHEITILRGMKILMDDEWQANYQVVLRHQHIEAIIDKSEPFVEEVKVYDFPQDHYLIPGLIDLHIHGANGADVMDCNPSALAIISSNLAADGVTAFLATTLTAGVQQTARVLQSISEAPDLPGASIIGIHLEGPFIAAEKRGAHGEDCTLPDQRTFDLWQRQAEGQIKLVTLAPELPGAIELIHHLVKNGVVVSIGHTNANLEQTEEAIAAGASHATHLYNAMSGIHHREPGAATALLLSPEIRAELIADGHHLHPAMLRMAYQLKSVEGLVLVTDAMRAKCLPSGAYRLGEQTVNVKNGSVRLPDGSLAGSTLAMPEALKNMKEAAGCSLAEVIKMASENPAKSLGLFSHRGSIAVGKLADLVILNPELEVLLTIRAGEVIFTAPSM